HGNPLRRGDPGQRTDRSGSGGSRFVPWLSPGLRQGGQRTLGPPGEKRVPGFTRLSGAGAAALAFATAAGGNGGFFEPAGRPAYGTERPPYSRRVCAAGGGW